MATSSILDSEATFVQQAEDAGLTQPWIDALRNNQLATFAKLSFAVTSPGVVATDEQVTPVSQYNARWYFRYNR